MSKKALVLCGGPRKTGNTEFVTENLMGYLSDDIETEKYYVADMIISPCIGCGYCAKTQGCAIKDDMQSLYKKIDEADIIIVSSPLYFNNVSAQLKTVIDRCQAIWASKFVLKSPIISFNKKRVGYFICTAGCENVDFSGTLMVMNLFFKVTNAEYMGNTLLKFTDNSPAYERDNLLPELKSVGEKLSHYISGADEK